jgi:hypothetical protein
VRRGPLFDRWPGTVLCQTRAAWGGRFRRERAGGRGLARRRGGCRVWIRIRRWGVDLRLPEGRARGVGAGRGAAVSTGGRGDRGCGGRLRPGRRGASGLRGQTRTSKWHALRSRRAQSMRRERAASSGRSGESGGLASVARGSWGADRTGGGGPIPAARAGSVIGEIRRIGRTLIGGEGVIGSRTNSPRPRTIACSSCTRADQPLDDRRRSRRRSQDRRPTRVPRSPPPGRHRPRSHLTTLALQRQRYSDFGAPLFLK